MGLNGINDSNGVFQPDSKFLKTYTTDQDLSKQIDSSVYDGSKFTNGALNYTGTYFSKGKLLVGEQWGYSPIRTQNTYNTSGQLIQQSQYYFDNNFTNNWNSTPFTTSYYTYDTNGNKIKTVVLSTDTTKGLFSYNTSNKLETVLNLKWNQSISNWDTLGSFLYTYPGSSSDWTKSVNTIHDPNTMVWGFVTDSVTRVLDANSQILTSNEYYDDGSGTIYFVNWTNTYFAPGKLATSYASFIQPYIDTFTNKYTLTFNALGNPITCNHLSLDAYGNPTPDTVMNTKDRYYYEAFDDTPAGINSASLNNTTMNVYPNPCLNEVHISCAELNEAFMTITNLSGQVVRSHKIELGNVETILNVNDLTQGLYMITLKDQQNGKMATQKLIKQ